jgi:hypothetical protein
MTKKEKFLLVGLIVLVVVTIALIINWVLFNSAEDQPITLLPAATIGVPDVAVAQTAAAQSRPDPLNILAMVASQTAGAESTPDPMNLLEMIALQTAAALAAPSATLPPGLNYWSPPANADFSPRFTYDSSQWALVDSSTLASLQTSGCTLRLAGGRGLGPDWSTEASSFQVGNTSFMMVLAKYQGAPQFITYSAPSGAVFEIASAEGFDQCRQAGEIVLQSMLVQ